MEKLFEPKTLAGLSVFNIVCIVFGGGFTYSQFQQTREDIAELKASLKQTTPGAAVQLARLEALMLAQRDDTIEIKRRLERLEERQ